MPGNSEDYPQITQITRIKKQRQDSKGRTEDSRLTSDLRPLICLLPSVLRNLRNLRNLRILLYLFLRRVLRANMPLQILSRETPMKTTTVLLVLLSAFITGLAHAPTSDRQQFI